MNKFTFALINEAGRYFDSETVFNDETVIEDLFDDTFSEPEWMEVLMQLQMLYAINIPDEMAEDYELTLGGLSDQLSELPALPDEVYPSFLDACITIMEAWSAYKEKASGEASEEERAEFELEFEAAVQEPYEVIDALFEARS